MGLTSVGKILLPELRFPYLLLLPYPFIVILIKPIS